MDHRWSIDQLGNQQQHKKEYSVGLLLCPRAPVSAYGHFVETLSAIGFIIGGGSSMSKKAS